MPLSCPDPQLADYIDHLRIMRRWLEPLESWLMLSGHYLSVRLQRFPHLALIDADFAEAGVLAAPQPNQKIDGDWSIDASAAFRWGAHYVVEGSRLGAMVLYRRMTNPPRAHALRYLRAENFQDRWPKFLRELRAGVRSPEEIAQACQGACASFDSLLDMCRLGEAGLSAARAHP